MQHILFPTDFSPVSGHALTYAKMLAKTFNARLTLVHVLHSILESDHFTRTEPVYTREEATHQLQLLKATIPQSVTSDFKIVEGIAVDAVCDLAKEIHADFIVVGTASAYNSPEVVAESHTADLISQTKYPVLAVPFHAPVQQPAKIVLALDFDPLRDLSVMQPLVDMARQFKAEVLFLSVVKEGVDSEEKRQAEGLRTEKQFSGLHFSLHFVASKHVDEGITRFAEEVNAQMIAVIKRKHGFFESFFHESVTKKVALYTRIPLLAMAE